MKLESTTRHRSQLSVSSGVSKASRRANKKKLKLKVKGKGSAIRATDRSTNSGDLSSI